MTEFLFIISFIIASVSNCNISGANSEASLDGIGITVEEVRKAEETVGNPESEEYDEMAFCKILQEALDAGILGEADSMRAHYRLEIASKNRPGDIAADFKFQLRNSDVKILHGNESIPQNGDEPNAMSLHSLKTDKPVVLLFYDPDCDHCMQTIAQLKESSIPEKAEIVAIYAEEDRERWEETACQLPENWIVGFALDPIQDDETYVFLTSPVVYLLDKEKRVILKDTNLPTIEKTLEAGR